MTDPDQQNANLSRGSEWRKWDLHVHSPLSGLNNQFPKLENGEPDWEAYIGALEALTDISVLGITDYFSIEGYRYICDARNKGKLKNISLVLPNIEFRLNKTIIAGTETKRLNYHVLFSESVPPDVIDEHFLQELKFESQGHPQDDDLSWSVRRANLTELGKRLKAEHPPFQEKSDYEVGCMNATVDPGKIKEILRNKEQLFKGKYLIVLAEENTSLMAWNNQYHHTRKVLLQGADAIFSGNPQTVAWARAENEANKDSFIVEFKSLKPCIHGSDAHRLEDIAKPDLNRFCWIKGNTTFEGLKQILYEPSARVFIGEAPPQLKNDYQTIDSVTLADNASWIDATEVPLNQDLIAIIGSRGSGKSALAELIAYAGGAQFFAGNEDKRDTFLSKASHKSSANQVPIVGARVQLKWCDGTIDSSTITPSLQSGRTEEKVKYLPQKFVERLCAPENTEHLEQEIERVIFQRIKRTERLDASTFHELRDTETQTVGIKRQRAGEIIRSLNQSIADAQARLASRGAKETELIRLKAELEQLQKTTPQLPAQNQADLTELEKWNAKSKELEQQIVAVNEKINALDRIKTRFELMREDVDRFNVEIASQLDNVGLADQRDALAVQWPEGGLHIIAARRQILVDEIAALRDATGAAEPVTLNDVAKRISDLKSQLQMSDAKRKQYDKFLKDKELLERSIQALEKELADLTNVVAPQIRKFQAERLEKYAATFSLLKEEKEILERLYQPLRDALAASNETAKKLTFVSRISFNYVSHAIRGMEILDRRKSVFRENSELEIAVKKFWEEVESANFEDTAVRTSITQLLDTFLTQNGEKVSINGQLKKDYTPRDFADWLFAVDGFSVTYSVRFDGKDLQLLSPGEKGIVLLLLYLEAESEDNRPLIIDQPDDNLDNLSVYPSLIEYFRARKITRQIIIITHNPNLVINTDAEQVLVANFDGSRAPKIIYRSGALEDSNPNGPVLGIREEACRILEGGTKAFQLREQRYSIR
jgi:predicted ABC-type transport system involved in lysophospholipase L1 biosynthesis ATPase subunit